MVKVGKARAGTTSSLPLTEDTVRPSTSRAHLVLDAAANIRAQRAEQAILLQRSETEGGASPRFAKGVDLQKALEYATTNAELAGTQGTCTACVVRDVIHRAGPEQKCKQDSLGGVRRMCSTITDYLPVLSTSISRTGKTVTRGIAFTSPGQFSGDV